MTAAIDLSLRWQVIEGDCLAVMPTLPAESVDAVVTDPPYALTANKRGGSGLASVNLESPYGRARIGTGNGGGFMGKAWDAEIPGVPIWAEALRVAKPGAHLLAFGGTRTFHRLTCAIEDAGWEIRDCLSWLYGSGFPKSHNGPWGGTALKPAWEPIILARKPLIGTVAANHAAHGTGALNIDGCRIGTDERFNPPAKNNGMSATSITPINITNYSGRVVTGRWPANVCLDAEAAEALDEQSGHQRDGVYVRRNLDGTAEKPMEVYAGGFRNQPERGDATYGGEGGASRFFYTAKASRGEREAGLDGFRETTQAERTGREPGSAGLHTTVRPNVEGGNPYANGGSGTRRNTHPTVKPVDLMRWLVRLVTPAGGLVLDPFTGSGTTGIAAHLEGCRFVGIEREAEYVTIARARIEAAARAPMFDFGGAK